jgi:hypothetical protein
MTRKGPVGPRDAITGEHVLKKLAIEAVDGAADAGVRGAGIGEKQVTKPEPSVFGRRLEAT